jgi:hypothetical protein
MPIELYVANIAPSLSDEEIQEIFADIGTVQESESLINQHTQEPKNAMRVLLETEKTVGDIVDQLTGMLVAQQPLYITNVKPDEELMDADEAFELTKEIAEQLGETEKLPMSQINRMARFAGRPFVETLLEETMQIEESGGMMTSDGDRRRTVGGIFFYLARRRLSYKMQRAIYYVQQKKKTENKSDKPNIPAGAEDAPPAAPITDSASLGVARQELEELRKELVTAQKYLDELKEQPAEDRKSGLFSATREVVNLQKRINAVLRDFPQLGN